MTSNYGVYHYLFIFFRRHLSSVRHSGGIPLGIPDNYSIMASEVQLTKDGRRSHKGTALNTARHRKCDSMNLYAIIGATT